MKTKLVQCFNYVDPNINSINDVKFAVLGGATGLLLACVIGFLLWRNIP